MAKQKVPEYLDILGKCIVIERKPLKDEHGYYLHDSRKIVLDTGLKGPLVWSVLLHEIIHAYLGVSGVSEILTLEQEEAICRAVENMADIVELKKVAK